MTSWRWPALQLLLITTIAILIATEHCEHLARQNTASTQVIWGGTSVKLCRQTTRRASCGFFNNKLCHCSGLISMRFFPGSHVKRSKTVSDWFCKVNSSSSSFLNKQLIEIKHRNSLLGAAVATKEPSVPQAGKKPPHLIMAERVNWPNPIKLCQWRYGLWFQLLKDKFRGFSQSASI